MDTIYIIDGVEIDFSKLLPEQQKTFFTDFPDAVKKSEIAKKESADQGVAAESETTSDTESSLEESSLDLSLDYSDQSLKTINKNKEAIKRDFEIDEYKKLGIDIEKVDEYNTAYDDIREREAFLREKYRVVDFNKLRRQGLSEEEAFALVEERLQPLNPEERKKEIEKFPEYFGEDGNMKPRDEIKVMEADLEAREQDLIDNPLYEDTVTVSRKYDSMVKEKFDSEIKQTIATQFILEKNFEAANESSIKLFGRPLDSLNTYQFKNQEEIDLANDLFQQTGADYKNFQLLNKEKVELNTFYGNIENKNAQAQYGKDLEGVVDELRKGFSSGRLNTAIISYDIGRPFNANDENDLKQIVGNIVKETRFQKNLLSSEEFSKFTQAANANEFLSTEQMNLLLSSKAGPEIMASLVGNSLSQMLTTGRYIIPSAVAAFAVKGGVFGTAAVPGAGTLVGAAVGAMEGLNIGMALTNGAVEYGNSIFEAMREAGYDMEDPEQVAKAMNDKAVWAKGRKIGIARAIPIMLVDYLGGKLAGKFVDPLASTTRRVAAMAAESTILQPGIEAIGEGAAQVSAYIVAGQEINLSEITMEALGGIGSKAPQLFTSVLYQSSNKYKLDLATKLGDNLDFVMEQNSPDRVNTWADNMLKQKLIDEKTHAKIKDNAKVSNEVNTIFDKGKGDMTITELAIDKIKNQDKNQKVKNRLADIISERGYLEKTLKEVKRQNPESSDIGKYKDALNQISKELNSIEKTGNIDTQDSFKTRNDLDALAIRQFEIGKRILGKDGTNLTLQEIEGVKSLSLKELKKKYNITTKEAKQLKSGSAAVNSNGKMLLNKDALRDGYLDAMVTGDASAYTVFSHEILHTVLSNKFSKKEITNISANLEAYVDSEVASGKGIISGRVKKRIDQRMSKYRNNDQYTKAMVAEEYLTVLSDEMASGAIKFEDQNKGFWNSIKEQIKDALFGIGMTEKEISDFQIETGEDAFNFLKTYSQTFKKDGIGVQVKNQKTNSGSTKSSTQLKQDDYDAIDALAANPDFDPDSTFDNKRLIKAAGGIIEATTKRLYDRTDAMNKIDVDRDKFKKDLASLFTLIFKNYDESADVNNNGIGKQTSNLYNLRANALATETFKQTATGVRIDENFDVAESLDESKINDNAKVRQAKPFSNLKNITEDVIVVLSSKIKSVLSDISIRTATPRTVIDQIKNLVKTDLFKDIKKGMGSISKPGGVVTVSPEYKAYHDNNYKEIVEAIPLSSAKKKYKALFKIEKIKREKDRKVNKETGKVTYPGTGVFKVQVPKKGEFGSYHTVQKPGMGINTLIERQTSLAKEIATGLTSEIVSTYIEENVTTLTKDMKLNQAIAIDNVFDQIKDSLDPNSNEQRKFDIVKATTQLTLETDLSKGLSIIDDLRQTVKSGISPEAAAVLMSSKYGIDEERFDGTIKILNIALSKFDLKDINPEVYKQIAEQEGINVDQQLEYDGNWETFLERTNLKKYSSYDYNEKDPKLRAKNKAKFEKSLTSYLLKLPDAVLNNQMFLQAFQNSTATGSFYANIDEIKNVVRNVKKARGKLENNSGIDWSKVNYSPEVARKLALLSNKNLKKPMSNQDLVKAYNKILAAHSIDIKETKKALKYILKSVDTFFNENNKSVEAGKFITTWMRMQTNFSKGIFRGAAQFESMSLTPSKTTFKTGSPALRAQVAEELGITSDEAKYLNNPSSQLSKASKAAGVTKKGIKAGLEARYTEKELKKLEADVKKGMGVPKEFHGEHDIALMLFTTNVFKTMNDGNFDTKYDDIAKYYSQTLLNENDRMLVDSKWGKTGNSPDYYFGMMPEIRFTEVIPGIAKDIFMFEYGTTLDQVILNKLASKEVLNNKDLTKKLVTALKESISTKSLQVVKDNKTTIISDPSIRETYNELISETATEIYNETDNSNSQATAVELTTQIENKQEVKETQKQNAEILETTNEVKASTQLSTNEIIENFKELDAQVENNRQEVMASSQLNLSDELNNVIQDSKGVNANYVYSKAKARALGSKVGKWKFFIPPSAEDFKGLLYSLLSKGKVGDAQLQMLKENLFRPFARGIGNINSLKQTIVNDYTALKKQYPKIKKLLSKEIPTGGFTYDTAARVYMWTKSGVEIPGLSKACLLYTSPSPRD